MRNIYFQPSPNSDQSDPSPQSDPQVSDPPPSTSQPLNPSTSRLKLRKVTISPSREYQRRSGQTEPIGHDLAAVILAPKGKAQLTPKGIVIDRADLGGRRRYHHPDHPLCNQFSSGPITIVYTVNIHHPELAHIFTLDLEYLGTLPQQGKVAVFDAEATATALAGKNRQISRLTSHMQRLHKPDTIAALAAAEQNAAEMQRIVQSLPASRVETTTTAETPTANRMGETNRTHAAAKQTHETNRKTAIKALLNTPLNIPKTNRIKSIEPEIINPFA